MIDELVSDRPNDGHVLHDLRQMREMLADVKARQ